MSQSFQFKGSLLNRAIVYSGVTIAFNPNENFISSATVCPNANNPCYNYLFSPNDETILWETGQDVLGNSINDIYKNPAFSEATVTVIQTYNFTASYQSSQRPLNVIYILNQDQTQFGNTRYTLLNNLTFSFTTTGTVSNPVVLGGVQSFAFTNVVQRNIPGASLSYQMSVTVNIECSGGSLLGGICLNICTASGQNLSNCSQAYEQACLTDTGTNGQALIFTSQGCRTFFADLMSSDKGPGSDDGLDNQFTQICAIRFPGDTLEQYRNAPAIDQDICGCHLNINIYNELQASLEKDFPGSAYAGELKQCLFPKCINSKYPTSKIGKACKVPECINLSSINNQGQVTGTINTSQQCKDLTTKGSAHNPGNGNGGGNGNGNGDGKETPKSWLEKHWVWVVVGVAIVVVLIIIIILLATSKKKKKPEYLDI